MLTMSDLLQQIEKMVADAVAELLTVSSAEALEQFRIKWLGMHGQMKAAMKLLGQAPKEQKPALGQRLNQAKEQITVEFERKQGAISADLTQAHDYVDVTEPGLRPRLGNRHILMKVVDELTELFGRMGFSAAAGPEVEDEFHNFIALNIPESHPARDPLDNFYLEKWNDPSLVGGIAAPSAGPQPLRLLRTQTSTVQIRVMEQTPPPVRIISLGRVYRPDTADATHYPMFHQIEGLLVDRHVTMADLKSVLRLFAVSYFGGDVHIRFRPSFFPFTEPSVEVDMSWHDRWIEMGGAGMVDPNVLRAVGYDPEEVSGFAFGLGVERVCARRHQVTDIREFYRNDIRFLEQF